VYSKEQKEMNIKKLIITNPIFPPIVRFGFGLPHSRFPLIVLLLALISIPCQKTSRPILAKVNDEVILVDDFLKDLPKGQEIETEDAVLNRYQKHLNQLIDRRLFIQAAKAMGLKSEVKNSFELNKRTLLIQKFYSKAIMEKARATPKAIRKLYEILPTAVHLRLILVATEDDARLVCDQLKANVPFETCAFKFSQHPSGKNGGDVGFGKLAFLPEPIRHTVEDLKPGMVSQPIPTDDGFAIVQLLAKKTEPVGSLAQEENAIRSFLFQQKVKELHRQLLAQLNSRLVYNHKALQVFFKPIEQITDAEKELWVCKKDDTLLVKVKSLLHIAESFNPAIDTALRIYAIKREIEDDLLYEEARRFGLDKDPKVLDELNKIMDELLYQAYYNKTISDQITVSDQAILDYYNKERANYPGGWNESVKNLIKNRLATEAKSRAQDDLALKLREKAKIEINERLLKSLIRKEKR
jgi:parvulin-like peptidyl-prolyl isomerase